MFPEVYFLLLYLFYEVHYFVEEMTVTDWQDKAVQ